MKYFVMGTAGHAGHGKTALIRALAGAAPETPGRPVGLARMRFDETQLDIVDLPGSGTPEILAAAMADADMALLVVSADEGIKGPTLEHLRILSLLDISRCIVVLTKTDLVDGGRLACIREEISCLPQAWNLPEGTPVVEVSARTGAGVERLLETIIDQCARMPVRRRDRPFYMHVGRVFRDGNRLVAMGTVREGAVRAGEEIMLCPGGEIARICSLDSGGQRLDAAAAGQRVSAVLAPAEEWRGEAWSLSAVLPDFAAGPVDVRLTVLPESPRAVAHGMELLLHVGAACVPCAVSLPRGGGVEPGESSYGQLEPLKALPALSGERFLLRFPTGEVAGGGVILDARAPRRGEKEWRACSARMSCYEYGGKDGRLHWEASAELCTEAALRERFARWSDEEFRRTRDALLAVGLLVRAGELLLGAQLAGELKGELIDELTRRHAQRPLEPGMPLEEAKRICPGGLLELCIRDGTVRLDGQCVSLPLFDPRKTRRFWQVAPALLECYQREGPMDRMELVARSGLPERDAALASLLLEQDGRITFPGEYCGAAEPLDRVGIG